MAALILPSRRVVQPQQGYTLNQTAVKETGTFFLTFPDKTLRDAVSGRSLANPGGLSFGEKGQTATFNGSQQGNLLLPIQNGHTNLIVAARIRATATQAGTPGAAFGVYQSTSQGGFGVGFDTSNRVGLALITNNGAYLPTYSAGVQQRWYTVYAQIDGAGSGSSVAYIDGRPVTNGQNGTYSGNPGAPNEIAIGAQHRSSGYLRQFRGDIEWASLMYVPGETWQSLTDEVALRLYESGYPYNLITPIQRRIIVDLGAGGGTGATASATPATVTTTAPAATATGAASAQATPAQVTAAPATATATGSAIAQATPADASATPATGAATGAALASATPAAITTTAPAATAAGAAQAVATPATVQLTPATATASGAAGGEVVASATPAPVGLSAPTATAAGGASAQATPAPITTTAPTASGGSGASASATLAALGLMPATGTATGGAAASALPEQIIITPAAGSAKGGAQAYSTPAQISITPATGIGSDGVYAPITWPSGASASQAAMVPAVFGLAIVQPTEPATVPRAQVRALVPIHGDDMTPIKTFELHPADREIYEVDFDRLYLSTARDTADTLEAVTATTGITITPEVAVGNPLASGVVRFAAGNPTAPGPFDVAVRISTAAGRKKTGVVTIALVP